MTFQDKIMLERLKEVFDMNFRVTRLYASYLANFPEAITEEIVDLVCGDGEISREEALAAMVAELFGLDADKSEQDKRIIRQYVAPSIRILDAEKYRNNPYYKNVKIENVTDGAWELRREAYEPYKAIIAGDMIVGDDFKEIPPLGFFTERFEFPAVLEGGNEWMTLTPVDLDTCEEAIDKAHGKVITFGLGLGYYAYMVSLKDEVDSITVIEKSPEVIRLFNKYIFPYFPHKDKVKVIFADAFEYAEHRMPSEGYDYAFVDTWRDASDGAPMYERMRALEYLSPGCEFDYWIEAFLISRLRALKYDELMSAIEDGSEGAPKSYEDFVKRLSSVERRSADLR